MLVFASDSPPIWRRVLPFLFALSSLVLFGAFMVPVVDGARGIDCEPCIKRPDYRIRTIVHGTSGDIFWQQVRSAILQAAKDMKVQIEFELHDEFNNLQMARDINQVASDPNPPDALLVTLPHETVKDAVQNVVDAGVHVFAFNNGYEDGPQPGILGFVGQDEYRAGVEAANEFIVRQKSTGRSLKRALFINHNKGNPGTEARLKGFNDTLTRIGGMKGPVTVKELVVDPSDVFSWVGQLNDAFLKCSFDAIMLGGASIVDLSLSAFEDKKCQGKTMLGTYDESQMIFQAISEGKLEFTISQQQYLQSALPVIMASIYATTGKSIVPPVESEEIFMTGPAVIHMGNIPSDHRQACAADAFPICNSNILGLGEGCDCIERPNIRIGGVVHGVTFNPFFSKVLAASQQAGLDMGIELDFELLNAEENKVLVYQKMAARIKALCESGVDGIFVSIPDEIVVEAIQVCQKLEIPIMSINSGAKRSKELDLWLHIGQLEHTAGFGAAQRLIAAGMTTGYCILHDRRNSGLVERCEGFQAGIEATPGITFGGVIDVPGDSTTQYLANIEEFVSRPGDWKGVGIMSLAAQHINRALAVKDSHNNVLVGSFDLSEDMLTAIGEGRVQFGIDQQPTMQGMMPVYLLTWAAYTKQKLLANHNFETGPKFVITPPSLAAETCENNDYAVCINRPLEDMNLINPILRRLGYVVFVLAFLLSLICFAWILCYMDSSQIVKVSQPKFLILLLLGGLLSSFSIITVGIETGYPTDDNLETGQVNAACMATPWLYGIGFSMMFSALFAKIWRVKMLYDASRKMLRIKIEDINVSPILIIMISIEFALLLSWQLVSPDRWSREVIMATEIDGFPLESVGECTSEKGSIFLVTLAIFHVFCLLYALVLCYQTKDIPSEFAESESISLSVMCMFQVLVIAIPIVIMVEDNKNVFYFVRACVVFLQNFTVICLIFIPKMIKHYKGEDKQVMQNVNRSITPSITANAQRTIEIEEQQSGYGAGFNFSGPLTCSYCGRVNFGTPSNFATPSSNESSQFQASSSCLNRSSFANEECESNLYKINEVSYLSDPLTTIQEPKNTKVQKGSSTTDSSK